MYKLFKQNTASGVNRGENQDITDNWMFKDAGGVACVS